MFGPLARRCYQGSASRKTFSAKGSINFRCLDGLKIPPLMRKTGVGVLRCAVVRRQQATRTSRPIPHYPNRSPAENGRSFPASYGPHFNERTFK